jgi:hypothetical protein
VANVYYFFNWPLHFLFSFASFTHILLSWAILSLWLHVYTSIFHVIPLAFFDVIEHNSLTKMQDMILWL